MSRSNNKPMVVGVGWYTPAQYSLLKAFASDPESLCSTHEEWLAKAEETFAELAKEKGIQPRRVSVDVQELLAWCQECGRPCDGESRAVFLREKVRYGLVD